MRWERLFSDLEAQLQAEEQRDLDAEVAERTRRERASVELVTRLAGQLGRPIELHLRTDIALPGVVRDVGADWLLVQSRFGSEALVPLAALSGIVGLGRRSESARTARRFGVGYAVRTLSRDRAAVLVTDTAGHQRSGTIDWVGADAFDVAEHPRGEARRAENVRAQRTIPFSALVVIEADLR